MAVVQQLVFGYDVFNGIRHKSQIFPLLPLALQALPDLKEVIIFYHGIPDQSIPTPLQKILQLWRAGKMIGWVRFYYFSRQSYFNLVILNRSHELLHINPETGRIGIVSSYQLAVPGSSAPIFAIFHTTLARNHGLCVWPLRYNE